MEYLGDDLVGHLGLGSLLLSTDLCTYENFLGIWQWKSSISYLATP
jgi:hypothetical protein